MYGSSRDIVKERRDNDINDAVLLSGLWRHSRDDRKKIYVVIVVVDVSVYCRISDR